MAIPDYYDDQDGGYNPGPDPNYPDDVPAAPTGPSQSGGAADRSPEQRQQIINGIIIPDFTRITGRAPSPQEIEEAFEDYRRMGGDPWRAQLGTRFAQGGGAERSPLYESYGGPGRPQFNIPGAPGFEFNAPAPFQAPSASEAAMEPGYEFRMGQGRKALEQSASGRGVLRTGGTLKDILNYGQNFASQEYGRVYDRKASEYDRTYGNQFELAKQQYAPKLADWDMRANAERRAGELEYGRGWDEYTYGEDDKYRRYRDILDAGSR